MDEFLLRALIGGIGVAAIAGPLGCFVVWRRMAYFGATMSHAALLGVALGFALGGGPTAGTVVVCLLIALVVVAMERRHLLASDTVMGILAHSALAFGVAVIAVLPGVRVDLMGYLFGDVLAVGWIDVYVIVGIGLVLGVALIVIWRPLLAATVHEELARVEGVRVTGVRIALMLMLALLVAIGMKIVGILLIVSLLVIPPAAARMVTRTSEHMALWSAGLAVLSVVLGLAGSLAVDTPAGPSIVIVASLIFAILYAWPRRRSPLTPD